MPVVRCLTSSIGHRENDTSADRTGELDGFFDLLVRCSELLRTCEVRYRSRFAMKGEDQGQVHQLLGLGVEHARSMSFFEVLGVALAQIEVATANFRHFLPHHVEPGEIANERRDGAQAQIRPRQVKLPTDGDDSEIDKVEEEAPSKNGNV
jgi:hypothetical protein